MMCPVQDENDPALDTLSFCQRVVDVASPRPDKVAMALIRPEGTESITFGAMLSQIRSIAYRLTQEQIAFGDRVAIIGENHPQLGYCLSWNHLSRRSSHTDGSCSDHGRPDRFLTGFGSEARFCFTCFSGEAPGCLRATGPANSCCCISTTATAGGSG